MSLMLINPRKRRSGGKKRRSAAQRAATARMVAARHGRASNPRRRRRHTARRSNPVGIARVHHTRRVHHRRRRNPIGMGGAGNIGNMVMNGLIGAVGSIGINAVTNFLPVTFKTGKVLYVTRAAGAILLGTVGRKFLGHRARVAAEGALAVNFADFFNSIGGAMLPGSKLHGITPEYMGAYLSGMPQALPYGGGTYAGQEGVEMSGVGMYEPHLEQRYL